MNPTELSRALCAFLRGCLTNSLFCQTILCKCSIVSHIRRNILHIDQHRERLNSTGFPCARVRLKGAHFGHQSTSTGFTVQELCKTLFSEPAQAANIHYHRASSHSLTLNLTLFHSERWDLQEPAAAFHSKSFSIAPCFSSPLLRNEATTTTTTKLRLLISK